MPVGKMVFLQQEETLPSLARSAQQCLLVLAGNIVQIPTLEEWYHRDSCQQFYSAESE